MHSVTLVLGGGRSGKSTFAEKLSKELGPDEKRRYYLATAEPFDGEMQRRIQKHQQRRGEAFVTREESIHLSQEIKRVEKGASSLLVECLSVWLGNMLYYHFKANESPEEKRARETFMDGEIEALLQTLQTVSCPVILVSNEINLEIFDNQNAENVLFVQRAEALNKRIAQLADHLYLCVAGIPLKLK